MRSLVQAEQLQAAIAAQAATLAQIVEALASAPIRQTTRQRRAVADRTPASATSRKGAKRAVMMTLADGVRDGTMPSENALSAEIDDDGARSGAGLTAEGTSSMYEDAESDTQSDAEEVDWAAFFDVALHRNEESDGGDAADSEADGPQHLPNKQMWVRQKNWRQHLVLPAKSDWRSHICHMFKLHSKARIALLDADGNEVDMSSKAFCPSGREYKLVVARAAAAAETDAPTATRGPSQPNSRTSAGAKQSAVGGSKRGILILDV